MYRILLLLVTAIVYGCSNTNQTEEEQNTCLESMTAEEQEHRAECADIMTTEEAYGYMEPKHYTVQVLALKMERDIRHYIQNIDKEQPIWVNWKTGKSNEHWYSVIMGDFLTKEQAQDAITKLPAVVKNSNPFIRTFAEVQRDQKTNVVRMR